MKKGNKNPKTMACSYVEYDRLSNLSDDLIYRILSFLSTKESYRTCVLSTRWRSIYTKIPDLHFEFPEESDLVSSKEIKYVYAALLRRTENLRKLSLYSRDHDIDSWQPQDIHMWVSKALDLKVKELDLGLELHEKTLLPCRLFTYESLVVLKLRGRIQPKLDSSFDVYLPSLKILHLQSTMLNCIFDDHIEYSLTNFLSGCPNLEELFLEESFTQLINVSLNSLKRLYICLFMPISHPDLSIYPLQINAPSLEVLTIMDFSLSPRKYEFTNLSNLDRAALCICKHSDFNSSYTILKELSNVKSLTLGHKTYHFLSMEDKLDSTHLLTFHNLLFLSIEISKNCNWNMLASFLHNAPKLKDLSIKKNIKKKSQRKEVGNMGWVGPSVIPTCLSTGLITFEFKGIQNIQTELDFARYIIDHSSKLKKVKIFTPNSTKIVESLLKGSRKSSILVWDIKSI